MAKKATPTDTDTSTVTATDALNADGAPVLETQAPAADAPAPLPAAPPKPIQPGVRKITLAQARAHHGVK